MSTASPPSPVPPAPEPPETAERPAPAGDLSWLPGLLQLTDSFFPTGAYAHSFGLEGLTHENVIKNAATLRTFLFTAFLSGLARVDLPLAALAWRALEQPDWEQLRAVGERASALKPSREPREASENIGRQRLDMLALLHPGGVAEEYRRRGLPVNAPLAAALEGRTLGAPESAVLAAIYYSSVAGMIAAAMKLARLGQNAAQSLLAEALRRAPEFLAEAVATPLEETGFFNPWLDIAAARHETADGRLFIS